jgi:hypothetical protein
MFSVGKVLPTLYICVFCGSENKQRLFDSKALSDWFFNRKAVCLLRGTFRPHSVFMCFYILCFVCLLRGTFCRNNVILSHYFTVQH